MDCEVLNFEHNFSKLFFFFISFTPVLCPDHRDLDVTTLTGGCECFIVFHFVCIKWSNFRFGYSPDQVFNDFFPFYGRLVKAITPPGPHGKVSLTLSYKLCNKISGVHIYCALLQR